MATYSISDAARVCGVARTTLQRAVRRGDLGLTAAHQVEEAALVRAGYLHAEAAEVLRLQQVLAELTAQVQRLQQANQRLQEELTDKVQRLQQATARLRAFLRRRGAR